MQDAFRGGILGGDRRIVKYAVDACRLLLLGPPLLQRGDRLGPLNLRKGLALVAYLAVERRAFTREYLATLLWPDLGQQSALADLRRILAFLRKTLGDDCLGTEGDLVRFAPAWGSVDFSEFQSLLNVASPGPDFVRLESAAVLYRGSFLEGFVLGDCLQFDDWQDGVRRRTEEQFDHLLEALCRMHLGAGRTGSALPWARRWLELDHMNEAAHRMIMEIHAREGRADLVRRQFEACRHALSQDGLEPEPATRDLHDAVCGHRPGSIAAPPVEPGASSETDARSRRRGRGRRIAAGVAGALLAAAGLCYVIVRAVDGSTISATAVQAYLDDADLSRVMITFRNDGVMPGRAGYKIVFSSDAAVALPRDYTVFEGVVRVRRGSERLADITRWNDIEGYVKSRDVAIPPGTYSVAVVASPQARVLQGLDLDERIVDRTAFFYPGTAPEAAFVLDVAYRGGGTLNEANPLKLFIGDNSCSLQRDGRWASYAIAAEGRYYLPVADLPARDGDGSGYALVVIHDAGNDLTSPAFPELGDVGAIYREGAPTNLSYGVSDAAGGSVIRPGTVCRIEFAPPRPPPADAWEVDDARETATRIAYDALPVRQRHTLHDEGTGDTDQDWYRIVVPAGATITVETFSAGGAWECDTAIDIADARGYLRTGNDKTELDLYSLLTHTNGTGADREFWFQAKPYPRYDTGINRFADYVVEFRR